MEPIWIWWYWCQFRGKLRWFFRHFGWGNSTLWPWWVSIYSFTFSQIWESMLMLQICYQRILNLKHRICNCISILCTFFISETQWWESIHSQAKKTGNVSAYFGSDKGYWLWEALQLHEGHLGKYWLDLFPHERQQECPGEWFSSPETRAPHFVWIKWKVWKFYYAIVDCYVNEDVHDALVPIE